MQRNQKSKTISVSKSEKYGLIGSVVSTVLVILLLLLIVMPGLKQPEEEGIMISFGNANDGGGAVETPASKPQVESAPTPASTPKVTPKEDVITQDDKSISLNEQKKKEKEKQEALEKKKKEEEQRKAEEKKRQEQEAIDKANNSMSGLFGNNGNTGSGNTSGNTTQGNPAGSGTSGGNSWSLNGRSLSGRLVAPSYENNVEGKITVNIRVDANGNVLSATIGSPTTISDATTRNAAISAAKSTKFSAGSGTATGSITYNFRLL